MKERGKRSVCILSATAVFVLVLISFSCRIFFSSSIGSDGSNGQPGNSIQVYRYTSCNGIEIKNMVYDKTKEVVIIPKDATATVEMADDSSWDTYYSGGQNSYKGVFLNGRSVVISPFIIGQYEVTEELFEAVMGENPSRLSVKRQRPGKYCPVVMVNWYQAIVFCNKLSRICNLVPCYKVTDVSLDKLSFKEIPSEKEDKKWSPVYCNLLASGYRLPTEAEWEFAARGGRSDSKEWKYAFAGIQLPSIPIDFINASKDSRILNDYGWCSNNSGVKIHEVGMKLSNSRGIYDMSGNVEEWCWDSYNDNVTVDDKSYVKDGKVFNPQGALESDFRVIRGGSFFGNVFLCTVSGRSKADPIETKDYRGFRLCRSFVSDKMKNEAQ